MNEKLMGMLGLAMKAGKIIIGTEQVCAGLAKRTGVRPRLVLISRGASENAKKKLTVKCEFYGTESIILNVDAEEFGRLLGKSYAPVAVAITDEGFAAEIKKLAAL